MAKFSKYLFTAAKILIALLAFYYIYEKISIEDLTAVYRIFNLSDVKLYLILFVPSILNWTFHIKKWQILSEEVAPKSFLQNARIALSSFSASVFTPNRIGEYGAMIYFYRKENWKRILSLNMFSNMTQLFATLLFFLLGYNFLVPDLQKIVPPLMFYGVLAFFLFLLFAFFKSSMIKKFSFLKGRLKVLSWSEINIFSRIKLIFLSVLRYLSFFVQFYLLLNYNQQFFNLELLAPLSLSYMLVSLLPSIFFAELLIRGSVAIFIFSHFAIPEINVAAVVFFSWLFNFALPAVFGGVLTLTSTHTEK